MTGFRNRLNSLEHNTVNNTFSKYAETFEVGGSSGRKSVTIGNLNSNSKTPAIHATHHADGWVTSIQGESDRLLSSMSIVS